MTQTETKLNVDFKILPFGKAVIRIRSSEGTEEAKQPAVMYIEPKTTDVTVQEINFSGENYSVPKTTGGFL
jgi:hypothetical protein